jgi:hypothetical protein
MTMTKSFGAAALAGLILACSASQPAIAQVRAALTKNVDEPGRLPFEAVIRYSRFGCISANCSAFSTIFATDLSFDGPVVPSGKRLIVQSVVGTVPTNSAPCVIALKVGNAPISPFKAAFPMCTQVPQGYMVSGNAFATYEGGEAIHILVSGYPLNGFDSFVTITGYLIDASN